MSLRTLFASAVVLVAAFSTSAWAQGGGICFFENADFLGRQFCINPGQTFPRLDPSWNDKISSVDIPPGVRVTLCEHVDFGGRCIQLNRPTRNLTEIGFNDAVSSLSSEGGRPRESGRVEPREFNDRPREPAAVVRAPDDLRDQMFSLRGSCESGDRRACVRLGIIIGENRGRTTQWRREDPDLFFWER